MTGATPPPPETALVAKQGVKIQSFYLEAPARIRDDAAPRPPEMALAAPWTPVPVPPAVEMAAAAARAARALSNKTNREWHL